MESSKESADGNELWLEILRSNHGFGEPKEWVEYAKIHSFKMVQAVQVAVCPDCGEAPGPGSRIIGQYVYYSNLGHIRECENCHLLYSTIRIDPEVIQRHFDLHAYVDEEYFSRRRKAIYDQVVRLVDRYTPLQGAVLDVGGAKGHLMALVRRTRPDLQIVVNDVSISKCEWAKDHHGLQALCGSAAELLACPMKFDLITLIDVVYYEPNLSQLWSALTRMLKPGGVLIIRFPNNHLKILSHRWLLNLCTSSRYRNMADAVRYFNPEHLYVLSQKYVRRRLERLGFQVVCCIPSALLRPELGGSSLQRIYYALAKLIHVVSCRQAIITPGILVTAFRKVH